MTRAPQTPERVTWWEVRVGLLSSRAAQRAFAMGSSLLRLFSLFFSAAVTTCTAPGRDSEEHSSRAPEGFNYAAHSFDDEPLVPLPLTETFDARRAALGELLFGEPRLSGDSKVACMDCHRTDHGLADPRPHSRVAYRPESATNSPTLYNLRFLAKLSWIGQFDSMESHLDWLMKNPKVMASSWDGARARLAELPKYRHAFEAAFPDGLTAVNVRDAVLEYERSLVTPNAPFDRYLRGDKQAITPEAKHGYALFKSYGCASCHQGMAVGGNVLEPFGVMQDAFADRGQVKDSDRGRFNLTRHEEDRFVFRVPSLRNVALTAPYFHDGSAATLEAAVIVMARYQLGQELEAQDRSALLAFLGTLTGEYRGRPL